MPLRIGMSAIQVVCDIAKRNKEISKMRFGVYSLGEFSPLHPVIERRAKKLRRSFRLHGYWQSILSVCWQNPAVRKELFRAINSASKHEQLSGQVKTIELERTQITEGRLRDSVAQLKPQESLFVSSKTRFSNGSWLHLPMMDFACYDTPHDLRKVLFALSSLQLTPGVLLRSGNSFHYYGYSPLTRAEWIQFLGKCLLLVPICDARYIGHRMIDGGCTLRVSSGPMHSDEPSVAAILK